MCMIGVDMTKIKRINKIVCYFAPPNSPQNLDDKLGGHLNLLIYIDFFPLMG